MKKLYTSPLTIELEILKSILEGESISCIIKDEFPESINLPSITTWPSLWIIDDSRFADAEKILVEVFARQHTAPAAIWHCPHCGSEVDGELSVCWKCNASKVA